MPKTLNTLVFTALITASFWGKSYFPPSFSPIAAAQSADSKALYLDKISVRESSVDLQVAVGDKIFVFGKARGTLDKVKVGMDVLEFSQAAETEGSAGSFSKVSWKKLKDGSIQIHSSYQPWPHSLSWTVFSSGQLKMEASSPSGSITHSSWLGLGFNYPDQSLNQVSWKTSGESLGQWKNQNYVPLAAPDVVANLDNPGFFQPFQSVRFEFESVTLEVSTESVGVFVGLGRQQDAPYPNFQSDLAFLFNQPQPNPEKPPQSPSGEAVSPLIASSHLLVLWFHFL